MNKNEVNEGTLEAPEEVPGEIKALEQAVKNAGVFLSPEAIIFLPLAALLDLVSIILVFFALDDFWITDIIGIIFIGGWIWFRSGTLKTTHKAAKRLTQVIKWAKRLKWLRPLLIVLEFIPYVGVAPCWVLVVYFELKHNT